MHHKLGYYVSYWYTGQFHRELLFQSLCRNVKATEGSARWNKKINCPECIRRRGKGGPRS